MNIILFIGGMVVSKNICELVGMKKVLLELGGNVVMIVYNDVDLNCVVVMCVKIGFSNFG